MDSEKKGLGTIIAERVRLRAVRKMVEKLEERRVSVEHWIEDALEEELTPEEFEEQVIEHLTLMYESKITGLGRSEDDIKREAARIAASYEYRKNHPEEKKEEDLNNATDLERQMDVITGIYEPMLVSIATKADDYISKLGIPKDDEDVELTPTVIDTIINDTDGLVKSIKDFKYLIDQKFKDVVSFATLNKRYKELTGKEYALDPNHAFRELTTKLYSQLQVQLNAIAQAINTNFDELDKAGITDRKRVSTFENIDKLLSQLDRLYENAKLDPSLASLTDSILDKDALKAAVDARIAKIKINGEPTRSAEESEPSRSGEKPEEGETFRDEGPEKKTPWYKRTIEKLKGIIPTREKKEKGEKKEPKEPRKPLFGGRKAASVITVKLTEDEIKELITRYKTRVSEFNEKVEKFNDLNVAIKAQYGSMTATSVEEIYNALKTFTFVSSYEEIAKLEKQAGVLRQEMDSLEVGMLSDRVKYLGATGKVLASLEELKEVKLDKPKGVLESAAILDFVISHDRNRLVIDHRLNEVAVELTDSALTPERRAELEKEKGKLEQYYISENSIITRAIVEACQADRTLSVDKINEQRKEKFKEIKDEIIAKLGVRKPEPLTPGPDKPDDSYDWSLIVKEKGKPLLDELGYDVLKMEGMGYGQMLNFISLINLPPTHKMFSENLAIIRELGLEEHMYEKKYQQVLVDPKLKEKYEALKAAGISKEDIVDKWLNRLFDKSISLEMLNAEIAKSKTPDGPDKPLTEDEEKEAILKKFAYLENYSAIKKASLKSLRLLTTVPEDLIKKNDKFLAGFALTEYSACSLLSTIDLEEKYDYLIGLSKNNTILSIVGHEKESLEEFRVYCEKTIGNFVSFMRSNYGLDYSVVPVEKQGEFVRYYEDAQSPYRKARTDKNIQELKTIFSNEEIVSKFRIFIIFFSNLQEMIIEMRSQSLTDEEIKDNYMLLTKYYEVNEDFVNAVKEIVAKRKPADKPLTPEAEKAALLEKYKGLGISELRTCLLEDLKMLAAADPELVTKNAEYIRSHKVTVTYISLCKFLTCVDFDKKYEFLKNFSERANIYEIIFKTKDLTFEEFKAHYKKQIETFVQKVKDGLGFDVTRCKDVSDIELIKLSTAYEYVYNKDPFDNNVKLLQELFTLEEIYEKFKLSDLFIGAIKNNLEIMRSRGLTDEEIKANYELLTVVSPDYSIINNKIAEIIEGRKKSEEKPEEKPEDKPEEPKLEGAAISEGKIELGRLRFRSTEPEEADRDKGAVERNVPMLRVEVYKNGIRVELYKEVKEQLKKLQVKVALVGKNKDGEWSKRAVAGTTTKIKPGETVDIIQEGFDPEEYALAVQSSYKDGDDYSEHKDTIRIR